LRTGRLPSGLLSKKAEDEGRTIVFADEVGVYLLPGLVRTWAPAGHTPILRAPLSRDHLAGIGGLTLGGQLEMLFQEQPYRGPAVVCFLEHLLRQIPGKLLVLWDGAPIHRCQVVKDFLAAGAGARLHLEHFPGYAPELNPIEGVWQQVKHVELRNVVCTDLAVLRTQVDGALERLGAKLDVLMGCLRQPGYIFSS
jgi:transposase